MLTKHHVVILGTQSRAEGSYPASNPLPDNVPPEFPPPPLAEFLSSTPQPGTIETYTVEYDRAGGPLTGWVIGRLESGERFLANVDVDKEKGTVGTLVDGNVEPIGMRGWVWGDGKKNWFRLGETAKM